MREKDCSKTGVSLVSHVCVVCLLCVVHIAGAEGALADSWNKYREEAAQAFQKEDLRQAENLLLEALHDAERLKKEGRVFVSLVELAWCELSAEKYAAGIGNLRLALALSETNHGADALETGVCLAWLGELQYRQKDFESAKKLFGRGAGVLEKAPFCSEKLLCELGRGQIAVAEVDYSKAEEYFRTALSLMNANDGGTNRDAEKSALFRSPFRPTYPTTADVLSALGGLYQTQKRWGEAETAYRQALEFIEKNASPKSGAAPAALNALASVYLDQTNFSAARPLLERSLTAQEQAAGPMHPVLIPTLSNLAQTEAQLGDIAGAERDYRRVLAIREKSLGPDHIRVQDSLTELSQFYLKQKNFGAAEPLCRRMLAREETFRGATSITLTPILSDLEGIYRQQGNLKDLEAVYQKQMRVFESAFGPRNNSVAKVLDEYAALLRTQQRSEEAAKLEARARAIRETVSK